MIEENGQQPQIYGFFSGNILKLVACAAMLTDHIGMIFFPSVVLLRIIGRLAMPLFAFTVAEGFYYTRRKTVHLIVMLAIGAAVSAVFSFAEKRLHFDILITFSLSALIVYALHNLKRCAFDRKGADAAVATFALAAAVALAIFVCLNAKVEYGIAGVMLPVTVRLTDFRRYGAQGILAAADNFPARVACFTLGLCAVSFSLGSVQWFCLFALPFVAMYNGKRGKARLKYFFYIFYVGHFILLGAVYAAIHPDAVQAVLGI